MLLFTIRTKLIFEESIYTIKYKVSAILMVCIYENGHGKFKPKNRIRYYIFISFTLVMNNQVIYFGQEDVPELI